MKIPFVLGMAMLVVSHAYADETTDRVAIDRTIAALNDPTQDFSAFAQNGNIAATLQRLKRLYPQTFRILPADQLLNSSPSGGSVIISHEPWGEAELHFPGREPVVTFVDPGVAIFHGAYIYVDEKAATQLSRLLIVLKKDADGWMIASIWVLGTP